jgi:cation:H+ antiporter
MQLYFALGIIAAASIVIMFACNSFEEASKFLGRNMKPGIRGATINAVGSSLPELFTASFLLFWVGSEDGFSAGIATCAGSAVFNAVVIPAVCILAVTMYGVKADDGTRTKVSEITLSRSGVIRDGTFFVLAEVILIIFLGGTFSASETPSMTWWMGLVLMCVYAMYFSYLMLTGFSGEGDDDAENAENAENAEDADDDNGEDDDEQSLIKKVLTLDFNGILFRGREFKTDSDTGRAWVVLTLAVIFIGGACLYLAEAIESSAHALDIPMYFTAVILGAAATSVPDTVLSVKDALKGDYDDAVSNAVGSNIFDITVCLGLPLMVYGLIHGDVILSGIAGGAEVQVLRIALLVVTAIVLTLFLSGPLGKGKAYALLLIYVAWTGFIVARGVAYDAGNESEEVVMSTLPGGLLQQYEFKIGL